MFQMTVDEGSTQLCFGEWYDLYRNRESRSSMGVPSMLLPTTGNIIVICYKYYLISCRIQVAVTGKTYSARRRLIPL